MPEYGETEIEADIARRMLTAARITGPGIDAKIKAADYHVFPSTTMTVCCLTLENGYCVIGQSAAASPENFDAEIGRKIAYADARNKIWQLEGYLLREQLHKETAQR